MCWARNRSGRRGGPAAPPAARRGLAAAAALAGVRCCAASPGRAWSPWAAGSARVYQSAEGNGDRLSRKDDVAFAEDFPFPGPTVVVSGQEDQEIEGFGAAFTEASALMFNKLPEDLKHTVLRSYWSSDGLGFTLGRVHINSCDFSPESYSFDDVAGDFALRHFDANVTHDAATMIPLIQAARRTALAAGADLRLLASPWSAPAWMKTNSQMDGSGRPGLRAEARAAWAKYVSKWVSAYKAHGVPIWAVTPQNEPENVAKWEACVYSPEEEMDWVGAHLGPALRADHPEVKIFVYDHNKHHIYRWAAALYSHATAKDYVTGVAFHWYTGDHFDQVARVHHDFPQAVLLASEATFERYRWRPGSTLAGGDWGFGLGYAHDILGDLNAGATGWIDWNLLLDFDGGPNHVDNVCDAAMLTNGTVLDVHPQFYAMGHFSKYVSTGSRRLLTHVLNSRQYWGLPRPYGVCSEEDGLSAASFLRPDGLVVVVVLNCAPQGLQFKLQEGRAALGTTIPARAIQTYIFSRHGSVELQV